MYKQQKEKEREKWGRRGKTELRKLKRVLAEQNDFD